MTRATVGVHMARLVRGMAVEAGLDRAELIGIPGLDPAALSDDRRRIPTDSVARLWELLSWHDPDGGMGLRVAASAPLGALGIWDYLIANSRTLGEGFRRGVEYRGVISDPSTRAEIVEDGRTLTLRWHGALHRSAAAAANHEFVMARHLWYARFATGRAVSPVRVRFSHPAPRRYRHISEALSTADLEFGAPTSSISFELADTEPALPHADVALGEILRTSTAALIATTRTTGATWHDRFLSVLGDGLADDALSLDTVAARMAMSPRTLQRHLVEHGTSFRTELDMLRERRVRRLLRDTELSVQSIATRVGFTDARALRKAFQRWHGRSPDAFRRSPAA